MALNKVCIWPWRQIPASSKCFPSCVTWRIKATQCLLREFVCDTVIFPKYYFSETPYFLAFTMASNLLTVHLRNQETFQFSDTNFLYPQSQSNYNISFTWNQFCFKRLYWEAHWFSHPCKCVAVSHVSSTWAKIMQFNLQVFIVCWAGHLLTGPWLEIPWKAR